MHIIHMLNGAKTFSTGRNETERVFCEVVIKIAFFGENTEKLLTFSMSKRYKKFMKLLNNMNKSDIMITQ